VKKRRPGGGRGALSTPLGTGTPSAITLTNATEKVADRRPHREKLCFSLYNVEENQKNTTSTASGGKFRGKFVVSIQLYITNATNRPVLPSGKGASLNYRKKTPPHGNEKGERKSKLLEVESVRGLSII